jgi:TRAP-type uncharacterized transport system substrate-binding protein
VERPRLFLEWVRLYALPALAVLAFLAVAVWMLDLAPRTHLTFAAGRPGSAYHELAERYRAILARDGIDLEILDSAGSVENLELLTRPEGPADAGFLQGGMNPPADSELEALAAVFLEPLWIFHSGALHDPADPATWQGLRIAAGEPGSGTRFVVDAVAAGLQLDPDALNLLPIGGAEAADALLGGTADVALFVAPVGAPYLKPLTTSEAIQPVSIRDAEALVRMLPFVQMVEVPAAGFDYPHRLPPEPIFLIAMVGRLVAQPGLHPALVDRLVAAARSVHSGRDLITRENQFPSTEGVAMPMNPQAANLLSASPSPLYRFLPYWVVAQVNKFALLLVPALVILFPLLRAIPGLYQWRMRSRVYRHYLDLLEIDRAAHAERDPARLTALGRRLDTIEHDLVGLHLPVRFREYAYTMRLHLDLVRRRIEERLKAR